MKFRSAEAVAPATSANLGSGFDVFGVALDALHDSVFIESTETNRIEISIEGVGSESIPPDPERNTAGLVARAILAFSKEKCGLKIRIGKGIKPGSGLGSSAASAAAAALAINEVLGLGLSKLEIIRFAAQGEIASAGAAHADNVSPAILGFFTIVKSYDPLEVISLPLPKNVGFAIALPEISLTTSLARSVLPRKVNLSDLVHNVGHAAALIAGIALNDVNLMGKGMSDAVVEPARASLIPGLARVRKSALESGAAGVAISGAGPSVLALVNIEERRMDIVAEAMKEAFEEFGIGSQAICARPGPGARIVRREP